MGTKNKGKRTCRLESNLANPRLGGVGVGEPIAWPTIGGAISPTPTPPKRGIALPQLSFPSTMLQ